MSPELKAFYISVCIEASRLSKCSELKGCCLAKGDRILSYGFNRQLIDDKKWEVSAIQDALFGVRDVDMTNAVIFSSCFPDLEDIKLIYATGIRSVYFMGETNKAETVEFLNSLSNPLEIVKLKK